MERKYYALWHRRIDELGYRHEMNLGIYSTRENAERGWAMLQDKVGFADYPDRFSIIEGIFDDTAMRDGFVTIPGEIERDEPIGRT